MSKPDNWYESANTDLALSPIFCTINNLSGSIEGKQKRAITKAKEVAAAIKIISNFAAAAVFIQTGCHFHIGEQ